MSSAYPTPKNGTAASHFNRCGALAAKLITMKVVIKKCASIVELIIDAPNAHTVDSLRSYVDSRNSSTTDENLLSFEVADLQVIITGGQYNILEFCQDYNVHPSNY